MLLGRWKSDAMLRYLRIQAMTPRFSQQMLDNGTYILKLSMINNLPSKLLRPSTLSWATTDSRDFPNPKLSFSHPTLFAPYLPLALGFLAGRTLQAAGRGNGHR
jgi:hypothetical protein